MFDFGFSEIILIALVALVVVGPERLPKLARTTGLWVGKMRRIVTDIKSEIDKEIAADELKKVVQKQQGLEDVYDIIEETKQVGQRLRDSVNTAASEVRGVAEETRTAGAESEQQSEQPADSTAEAEQEPEKLKDSLSQDSGP